MPSDIAIVYVASRVEQRILESTVHHKFHQGQQGCFTMLIFGVIITGRRAI